jgi:hypothetical protein
VWESDDDDGGGGGGVQDGAAAEAAVEGLGAWGGGAGASSDEGGHQGRCRARTAVASSAGAVGSAGTRARGGDRARAGAGEGGVADFVYQPGSLTVDPNQAEYPQLVEPPFTSEKADIVLAPSETAAEHNAKATRGAQWSTETLVCPAAIAQYLRDYQKEGVRWLHAQYRLRTHATSTKPWFGWESLYFGISVGVSMRWWGRYRENKGGILGDDMGLGKTVQTCAFLAAVLKKTCMMADRSIGNCGAGSSRAVLICVPTSVLHQWER